MILEVLIAIAVLIFAVLAVFIILTLTKARRLFKDLDFKLKSLTPVVNALSNVGSVCEKKSNDLSVKCLVCSEEESEASFYPELAILLLLTLKSVNKYLKRR